MAIHHGGAMIGAPRNKKMEEQDVTFASAFDGCEFARGAGFQVKDLVASRHDMTRTFTLEQNKAGRWEWK